MFSKVVCCRGVEKRIYVGKGYTLILTDILAGDACVSSHFCSLFSGGQTVKVWDALTGGKLITTLSNHHKTITSLGFCSNYQRLLSGGLDR